MKRPIDLLQLLKLNEKQLDKELATSLQAQIECDPQLKQNWNRVAEIGKSLMAENQSGVMSLKQKNGRSVERLESNLCETISAFIEGRLEFSQQERFEAQCWSNENLLVEVVDAFRFYCSPVSGNRLSPSLNARLIDLFDIENASQAFAEETQAENSDPSQQIPEIKLNQTPTGSGFYGPARSDLETKSRHPNSSSRLKTVAIVAMSAAALILTSVIGWAVFSTDWSNSIDVAEPDKKEIEKKNSPSIKSKSLKKEIDSAVDLANKNKLANQNEKDPSSETDEVDRFPRFDRFVKNRQKNGAENRRMFNTARDFDKLIAEFENQRNDRSKENNQLRSLPIDWTKVVGVAAKRKSNNDSWHGLESNQVATPDVSQFATLEGSWASATIGNNGRLVLAENTQMSIRRSPKETRTIVVDVDHGKVAMENIPQNAVVEIHAGKAVWTLAQSKPNSVVGIDWLGGQPRIQVRRGKLAVNQEPVTTGQQVVYTTTSSMVTEPVVGDAKWIDRPVNSLKMTDTARSKLMESTDLFEDLKELRKSKIKSLRILGNTLSRSIDYTSTYELLSSPDAATRTETLEWLFNKPFIENRRVWQGLVIKSGRPRSVRQIHNWIVSAQSRKPVTAGDFVQLTSGLKSDDLMLRHTASYFLGQIYGNSLNYSADDSKRARDAKAEKWKNQIEASRQMRKRQNAIDARNKRNNQGGRRNNPARGNAKRAPESGRAP